MAPEQCRDSGSVTERSDVYALGVILYQFVSGQLPFSDPDPLVLLRKAAEPPIYETPTSAEQPAKPIYEQAFENKP